MSVVDAAVWERLGLDLRYFAMDGDGVWETSPENEGKPINHNLGGIGRRLSDKGRKHLIALETVHVGNESNLVRDPNNKNKLIAIKTIQLKG